MTSSQPPAAPDDLTGKIILSVLGIASSLVPYLVTRLKNTRRKHSTDEFETIRSLSTEVIERKDQLETSVKELEGILEIRQMRINALETEAESLKGQIQAHLTALAIRDNQVKEFEVQMEIKRVLELENETLKGKLSKLQPSAETKPIKPPEME